MKNYRSYFKANLKLLLSVLGIMLLFDAAIIMSGIENRFNGEFLISMLVFLGVTVAVMALLCMLIVRTANKMIPVAKIIDEKGMCPEAIEKYRQLNPKMGAKEHCVLASYYLAMEDTDSAENELTAAGQLQNLAVQKVVNLQVSQYTGLQLLRKGVTASGVPQAQVVFHRKLLKERCGLGNVADYMRTKSRAVEKIAGLRERGLFKKKFPFISLQCTCKDSEQCRLSAAILPENAD